MPDQEQVQQTTDQIAEGADETSLAMEENRQGAMRAMQETINARSGVDSSADNEQGAEKDSGADQDAASDADAGRDEFLVSQAEQIGFTREEAESFGSDAALARAMTVVLRRMPSKAEATEEEPAKEKKSLDGLVDLKELGLEDEDYEDVKLYQAVKEMNRVYAEKLAALEQTATEGAANERERANMQMLANRVDQSIQGLGQGWGEIFGEGAIEDLEEGAPQVENRLNVWRLVQELKGIDQQRGVVREPSMLVRIAANSLFPDNTSAAIRKDIVSKAKKRQENIIEMPGRQDTRAVSDTDDQALDAVRRAMNEKGYRAG